MGAEDRIARPGVSEAVEHLDREKDLGFFQAVRLFQHLLHADGDPLRCGLRFRANPSLAFPLAEIEGVTHQRSADAERIWMTINLLGLYGPSSPIPTYYTEELLASDTAADAARPFLDLFNNRFASLLYQCWEKYRYYLQYRAHGDDAFSARIFALIGLGPRQLRNAGTLRWERLLPYIGLLSMRVKSASVISGIVSHYFGGVSVRIEEHATQMVSIDKTQWCLLGEANCRLGVGTFIGARAIDAASNFNIHIGPVDYGGYERFAAGGEDYRALRELLGFVLTDRLGFQVKLHLKTADIPGLALNRHHNTTLGRTSWLGKPQGSTVCIEQEGM